MLPVGTLINMKDMIFGRLLVIERSERRKTDGTMTYWWCRCSCGYPKLVRVRSDGLRRGTTRSCGCLRRELMKTKKGGNVKGKPHKYPATRKNTRKEVENYGN